MSMMEPDTVTVATPTRPNTPGTDAGQPSVCHVVGQRRDVGAAASEASMASRASDGNEKSIVAKTPAAGVPPVSHSVAAKECGTSRAGVGERCAAKKARKRIKRVCAFEEEKRRENVALASRS